MGGSPETMQGEVERNEGWVPFGLYALSTSVGSSCSNTRALCSPQLQEGAGWRYLVISVNGEVHAHQLVNAFALSIVRFS